MQAYYGLRQDPNTGHVVPLENDEEDYDMSHYALRQQSQPQSIQQTVTKGKPKAKSLSHIVDKPAIKPVSGYVSDYPAESAAPLASMHAKHEKHHAPEGDSAYPDVSGYHEETDMQPMQTH